MSRQKVLTIALTFISGSLCLGFITPWLYYRDVVDRLPDGLATQRIELPAKGRQMIWFSMTGQTNFELEPVTIWRALSQQSGPSGFVAAQTAASRLLEHLPDRFPRRSVVNQLMVAVWLSENRSADQVLDAYLFHQRLPHGFQGLEPFAQALFERPLSQLTLSDWALLAAVLRAPRLYDPWCHPEQASEYAQRLLARFDSSQQFAPQLNNKIVNDCP